MKALRRARGYADCRVRLPRKSKCLCPLRKLQKPCFPWHLKTWEHELWKKTRSDSPPNTKRPRRLARRTRNLETDACSGHSQTSGDTRIVWRLDIYRKECRLAFLKVVSRFAKVDDFLATESEDTGGESNYSEGPTTCQDAQNFLNSRRKNVVIRERIESWALYTSVQEKTCAEKINDKSCRR